MPICRKKTFLAGAAFLVVVVLTQSPHSRGTNRSINEAATADDAYATVPGLALVDPPREKISALYRISIQGVVVGTASVGIAKNTDIAPSKFELRVLNRVGTSPILDVYSMQAVNDDKNLSVTTKLQTTNQNTELYNKVATWTQTPVSLKLNTPTTAFAQSFGAAASSQLGKTREVDWSTDVGMLFYKPAGRPIKRAFLPFSEQVRTLVELKAEYDSEGLLVSAIVPWTGGTTFEFTRLTLNELAGVRQQLNLGVVDLAWFSDANEVQGDVQKLRTKSSQCRQNTLNLEDQVSRKLPEIPYLLHRKLYNLGQLCSEISQATVSLPLTRDNEIRLLEALGRAMSVIASDDKRELPFSLNQSSDWKVLRDDSKKWQWPRLISYLITQAENELEQAIAIETTQKTSLSLRVSVDKLGPRAVVKGILKPRDLSLKTFVEPTNDGTMLATSLTMLPKLPTGRFDYVNGQAFARGLFNDLEPVCELFTGRVGLDLGNASSEIFRSDVVHGVWDNNTRAQLAAEFTRRAAATTKCHEVYLRIPKDIEPIVSLGLQNFKSEVLQTETAFQFSNGGTRRMRLIPGVYDFVASSLISGQVLGRQELIVKQAKQSNVTLRFK